MQVVISKKSTETAKTGAGAAQRKFRCSFCQRVYPEKQTAIECAKACRAQAKSKLDAEKKFQERHLPPDKLKILENLSGGDEALDEARQQLGKNAKAKSGKGLFSKGPKKPSASVFNKKDDSAKQQAQEQASKAPVEATDAVPLANEESTAGEFDQGLSALQLEYLEKAQKINATKDNDKFVRDGARYVCRVCNERFFTKMEVVQCFDKHLDPAPEEDDQSA